MVSTAKRFMPSATQLRRQTPRLVIRPYKTSDFSRWVEGYSGRLPKQSPFDPGPVPKDKLTPEAFRRVLKAHEKARERDFLYAHGVFLRSTGQLVGSVDLLIVSRLVFQTANL